jgi:hypothetical protein
MKNPYTIILNNQELFQTNSPVHCMNTRNKHNFRRTTVNLLHFQKCEFGTGIKFLIVLLSGANVRKEKAQFKVALRR